MTVRHYCAAVFLAGCAAVAGLAGISDFAYVARQPWTFGLLSAGVLLGEMLPVKIPRRGNDEEITLSTCFTMALLLAGGLAPALIAQGCASVMQDRHAGKPWWRVRFNLGQYALSMAAALIVLRLLSATPHTGSAHPFTSGELPAVLLAAVCFFFVNAGAVSVAVALHQGVSVVQYFRNNVFFVITTGGVVLFLAPLVVAATAYSVSLIPLFAVPMLAIYHAGREASRSEHAARHDSLTGLLDRAAFHTDVESAIRAGHRPCSILLMDLDRFKEVNDTLGHGYGDLLLEQIAQRLREQVGADDEIARLGGDEFAIFSPARGREASLQLATRVTESLRAPFELKEIVLDAEASVGIALCPEDGSDVETLIQKADVAMYRAKETRTAVALYKEADDHHSPAKLALTADLRRAIEGDELVVWYQPELDLRTDHVPAVEALVRWEHPDLGLLMPGTFIEMAEHTNLIKPLTQRVLEMALHQVAQWHAMDIDVAVAVNVSARVLVDQEFPDRVMASLAEAGVAASRLKLEVTESTLMADPQLARSILQELDLRGVQISIDDFGIGYSSLAYMADLPVSEVKIDRSFVSRMAEGTRDTIIVRSTIDLAHHLELRAVAEGVEDLAQLTELRAFGCDAAQGYAISRPLPGPGVTDWLIKAQPPAHPVPVMTRAA